MSTANSLYVGACVADAAREFFGFGFVEEISQDSGNHPGKLMCKVGFRPILKNVEGDWSAHSQVQYRQADQLYLLSPPVGGNMPSGFFGFVPGDAVRILMGEWGPHPEYSRIVTRYAAFASPGWAYPFFLVDSGDFRFLLGASEIARHVSSSLSRRIAQ